MDYISSRKPFPTGSRLRLALGKSSIRCLSECSDDGKKANTVFLCAVSNPHSLLFIGHAKGLLGSNRDGSRKHATDGPVC
jgi:hypothetical protein